MKIKLKTKMFLYKSYMKVYSMFHKVENQVIFESFTGKQYSDNPRAVSETLHNMFPEHKIIWAISDEQLLSSSIPDYVKIIPRHNKIYYETLATSFCMVTNENFGPNINKRKGQYFVQTWHGDRAFKKILYDAYQNGKRPIPVEDKRVTDLCVAASDFGEKLYRTAFQYNGDILKIGMPRNDKLVVGAAGEAEYIRKKLKIDLNTNILLYAPTFRDYTKEKQSVMVDLKATVKKLEKQGKKWVCLIRAHSASAGLRYDFDKQFIDVSDYPDMADLLFVSDMLITDYSSSAGDFVLCKKPVILAVYDKDEYSSKCREFYFNLEDSGFIMANSQDELESIIDTYTEEDYKENCQKVMDYFNIIETGKASQEICKRIHKFYCENYVQ